MLWKKKIGACEGSLLNNDAQTAGCWAYFDYAATTPIDPQVLALYTQSLTEDFANSGATHGLGLAVRDRLEQARSQFARAIGADAREIVFTSGATEADNLALKGAVGYHGAKNPRIISLQSEHKAVLDPLGALATQGVAVEILPVQESGLLDLNRLQAALKTPTTLVSVMAVNNETGVVQPIAEIAEMVHQAGAKLHVDAAQALGKWPVDVAAWQADLVSFSGHKVYAPKGVGALYVRRLPKMRLQAQMQGGGQERGRRSGTLPVSLIRAFAEAATLAVAQFETRFQAVSSMAEDVIKHLPAGLHSNVVLEKTPHVPHMLSIDCHRPVAEVLAMAAQAKIALSAGSACQSGSTEGSHVLQAMGRKAASCQSVRICLSHLSEDWALARLQEFLTRVSQ